MASVLNDKSNIFKNCTGLGYFHFGIYILQSKSDTFLANLAISDVLYTIHSAASVIKNEHLQVCSFITSCIPVWNMTCL